MDHTIEKRLTEEQVQLSFHRGYHGFLRLGWEWPTLKSVRRMDESLEKHFAIGGGSPVQARGGA